MKAHWQPKMDKASLINDLNEWMQKVTKDPQQPVIQYDTRISLKELEIICYAISVADQNTK